MSMNKFKSKSETKPEVSTASLPDIVFLLLFFFMVSATIRPEEKLVEYKIPDAEQITYVERKKAIKEIRVGYPKDESLGNEPQIAVDDRLLPIDQIPQWVEQQRTEMSEIERPYLIVMIKSDEEVPMGFISDVQEQLRKVNALKVMYRTLEE